MGKLIKLWLFQAFNESMEALEHFQKTGDRSKFRAWSEKYDKRIAEELESDESMSAMEHRIKSMSVGTRDFHEVNK